MSLQAKYQELIDAAKQKAPAVKVVEQDGVLYIDGSVNGQKDKDDLWEIYNKIDPDYRSADLRLNIEVSADGVQEYVVKSGDSLSKIGSHFGVSWKTIFEANKDVIKNPDLIQPGWKLKIPAKQ